VIVCVIIVTGKKDDGKKKKKKVTREIASVVIEDHSPTCLFKNKHAKQVLLGDADPGQEP
jgi:hypothetical protein